MSKYYFALGSKQLLMEEEPLEEIFRERTENYMNNNKEIDFWLVSNPKFLDYPALEHVKQRSPYSPVAIISTNPYFIYWIKLRISYVLTGEFESEAPLEELLASYHQEGVEKNKA